MSRVYAGVRHVRLRDLRELGYDERCLRDPQAQRFVRSYNRARGRQHSRRVRSAAVDAGYASGDLADVPGVPRSFAACVAFRESTDGRLSPNIYGLLSYSAGESLAAQKRVFSEMFAARGDEPWRPYDHCSAG